MAPSQTILVTGANRGIGFAIVQATALQVPDATYILGCRSQSSGEEAISQLKSLGITSTLDILILDITSDPSILSAKETIESKYGHLDVLVNNAGIAIPPTPNDISATRESFNTTLNTNITSLYLLTTTLLPLLRLSPHGKVINISSGRASLALSQSPSSPPTSVLSYSVSKVALSGLTIELSKGEEKWSNDEGKGKVDVWAVNPGFCKTAFNGFKGTRDPLEGAGIVVRLVQAERGVWRSGGFWEEVGGVVREVPW